MRSPVSWELSGAGGGNDILFSFTELVPLLLGWLMSVDIGYFSLQRHMEASGYFFF